MFLARTAFLKAGKLKEKRAEDRNEGSPQQQQQQQGAWQEGAGCLPGGVVCQSRLKDTFSRTAGDALLLLQLMPLMVLLAPAALGSDCRSDS